MLADPRARALVDNFASQWLMLRNLKSHIPNPGDFPNFDNELRDAFRTETELFFQSIVREDRSVLDLLNADYTFVERAARAPLRDSERLRQPLPPRARSSGRNDAVCSARAAS